MYVFEYGDDSKNKLKSNCKSPSENIKFEEQKNCLDGKDCQRECDAYLIRSLSHETYLQKKQNLTISI